ncbi:hypothetical protein SteCoe_16719 [Stentor coeruleus]|uniref:BACK domain-containing protein n=1 Tax=Stentor coeruleus TaxID=5963 RepID=A0A1R2C0L6_9CILI|nr:hypothetical protein SteCoe_16719 [Stentor coeruleus]
MKNFAFKHRPQRIVDYFANTERNSIELKGRTELKAAIHSKLSNEVLELEEFRKISLQKISEMLQFTEKQLLETVEKLMNMVSDECENAQREIRNAIALLRLPEIQYNPVLSMFDSCKSPDDVRDLNVIYKNLDLEYPNMHETIHNAVNFCLQVTTSPVIQALSVKDQKNVRRDRRDPEYRRSSSNNLTFRSAISLNDEATELEKSSTSIGSKLSSKTSKPIKPSPLISKYKTQRSVTPSKPKFFENIEMELKKPKQEANSTEKNINNPVQKNISLLFPYIVYFFPTTNRFTIYNVIEANFKSIVLPNKMFLEHSAWSLCEGGRIIQTCGFDTRPRSDVFVFKFSSESAEKCSSTNYKRYKHAQVSLGNYVYVIGGFNKIALKSVERLNLLNFKWRKVGGLNIGRVFPTACAHHGKIYVAGGEDERSIECFNTLTKKFTMMSCALERPFRNCMFSYDDKILILQGSARYEWDGKSPSMIKTGNVDEKNWLTMGDYYAISNEIYFISEKMLFRYDLIGYRIILVKAF